jgi:hypothetical protein
MYFGSNPKKNEKSRDATGPKFTVRMRKRSFGSLVGETSGMLLRRRFFSTSPALAADLVGLPAFRWIEEQPTPIFEY